MRYIIGWRGEEVDEFSTRAQAMKMLIEYNMAFNGGCSLRIKHKGMTI